MGRVLFFVILGVGLYVAFRIWQIRQRQGASERPEKSLVEGEAMVRCGHCGLNVPESEAVADGDRWYCSENHRRLERNPR